MRISEVPSKISRVFRSLQVGGKAEVGKEKPETGPEERAGGTLTKTSNFGLETVILSGINTALQNYFSWGSGTMK